MKWQRACPAHDNCTITGLLGTLILAKRRGLIPAVRPLITELRTIAGCRFADVLIAGVLREVGEQGAA